MATKRSSRQRRVSGPKEPPQVRRTKTLLALTLVPMAAGLILIVIALIGLTLWISPVTQAVLGGLLILVSFAASNALQKQWLLAAGWLLVGVGIGLGFGISTSWATIAAFLLGGVGLYLLLSEFSKRGWEKKSRSNR